MRGGVTVPRMSVGRRAVAWAGLWLLLVQLLVGLAPNERLMPAYQEADDGVLIICTGHGMIAIGEDGQPRDVPADRRGPSCIFCLPLSCPDAGALAAVGVTLVPPTIADVAPATAASVPALRPYDFSLLRQSRAPPLPV